MWAAAAAAGIIIIRLTLTDKKSSCCCCKLQAVCTSSCLSFCFRFPVMTKTGRQRGIPEFPPNLPPLLLPIEQEKRETFHLIAPVVRRRQQSYPVQAWYSDKKKGKKRKLVKLRARQGENNTTTAVFNKNKSRTTTTAKWEKSANKSVNKYKSQRADHGGTRPQPPLINCWQSNCQQQTPPQQQQNVNWASLTAAVSFWKMKKYLKGKAKCVSVQMMMSQWVVVLL